MIFSTCYCLINILGTEVGEAPDRLPDSHLMTFAHLLLSSIISSFILNLSPQIIHGLLVRKLFSHHVVV